MSFKLLAIRPLEGTSKDLIKSLKMGEIYKLYNEYSYTLDKDNDHIASINYTPIVPSNLYGKNINVSALVGKNGSGKSSLLELFYYATLISNLEHINTDIEKIRWLDMPCCVDIILLNDHGNIEIINISHRYINIQTTISLTTFTAEGGGDILKFNKTGNTVSNGVRFNFYSNVINYSIYGLNSETLPWLDYIFKKNDGYQLPIVISPFKENGNFNINNEYLLMQSRAIFYSKILGKVELIDDIYIEDVHFKIQLDKILKITELEKSSFDSLSQFISNLGISEEEYNRLIFEESFGLISLNTIRNNIPYITFSKDDGVLNYDDLSKKDLLSKIDFYKSLVYLYVFKKLYKISRNYKKYRKFLFLFYDLNYFNFKHDSLTNINNSDSEEIVRKNIFDYVANSIGLDTYGQKETLNEYDLFEIKSLFRDFHEIISNDKTSRFYELLNGYKFDSKNVRNNIKPTREIVEKLYNSKEFREFCFKRFVLELNYDTSHITFKLNQAKNYFINNIFESIEVDKSVLSKDDKEFTVEININNDYLLNKNKIEEIPLAVFEHSIQVVKTGEKKSDDRNKLIKDGVLKTFSYTSLSSGEQHLMNSMLTIAYHIYNLQSVTEDSGLIKFNNINLIFDELELYLHPEYQRQYISNLINLLNRIADVTNYKEINYNILMVSHSPFILSDIPSENVLKLENGESEPNDLINSFAANIYDLLKDEFFLENGTIGAYAQHYINNLIEDIDKLKSDSTIEKISNLRKRIKIIGEELIKQGLEDLLVENIDYKEYQIKILQQRIDELNSKNS
ncbi:AAA family ATPase [Sphingobacterium endophyticum]|uniref:hypothetical protein n=1 Tax=Sphingobacterium endophyticum TaxID=2546448 RepID=UPI0012E2CDA1|nr:hypothetical protein [Sphingobacterium endophyticum]